MTITIFEPKPGTMQVAEIELFKILKTKFTEVEAEKIIANLENKVNLKFEERKDDFATKKDIADLELRLVKLVSEVEVKLTRNIFIASVGQFLAILASVIALIKLMK